MDLFGNYYECITRWGKIIRVIGATKAMAICDGVGIKVNVGDAFGGTYQVDPQWADTNPLPDAPLTKRRKGAFPVYIRGDALLFQGERYMRIDPNVIMKYYNS